MGKPRSRSQTRVDEFDLHPFLPMDGQSYKTMNLFALVHSGSQAQVVRETRIRHCLSNINVV